ncbi:PilT protein domain protein [Planktothrix serta PCC 8927]|uniref:PilT protein domain protein n=1 Tax=Planktothrix serta PCC 8927 TaxID=671068 RepID=A0A7Z9BH39_9CYAN|nr:type II toxin-antitoxin system VapC family toxin [Planktothrix serta]VXD13350.1 PilT protein domain protein [Planktothrix serta PCC 8927]
MQGLDTNILVRYLVQDDLKQSQKATELINQLLAHEETILINNIVLCELIWVLESAYKYKKIEIYNVLNRLLSISFFEFENREIISLSLEKYKNSKADFSDCLVATLNQSLGCDQTF